MKKLSTKALIVFIAVLAAFAIYTLPRMAMRHEHEKERAAQGTKKFYYCPMHPGYRSDKPGDCPICYMKLVPKETGGEKGQKILYYRHPMGQPDMSPVPKKDSMGMDYIPVYADELGPAPAGLPSHATVRIGPERQQLIGVKLGSVEKRVIIKRIRTTGRVAFDPELYTAQQEFLSAVNSVQKADQGPYHEPPARAGELVNSVKIRLNLLGMSDEEIVELEEKAIQNRNLILPPGKAALMQPGLKPMMWVYAPVYEYELPHIRVGTQIKVRVLTYPDKEFAGKVRALDPVLDTMTRSVRMRIEVDDPEGMLKPGMYVDVYADADLGTVLSLPKDAVMQTGERSIVFVAHGEGYFQPREVKIGVDASGFYEVKSGVKEGERVVISGNFLIDSESRLQAALAGMSAGGHQHGQ